MNYWQECISQAFEDAGIVATKEQIEEVSEAVEGAHDNYGQCHGYECIPNPQIERAEKAEKLLKEELEKVHCRECNGSGRTYTPGPYHGCDSQCWKCNGEGKHSRFR